MEFIKLNDAIKAVITLSFLVFFASPVHKLQVHNDSEKCNNLGPYTDRERGPGSDTVDHRHYEASPTSCQKASGEVETRASGCAAVMEYIDKVGHDHRLSRDGSPACNES